MKTVRSSTVSEKEEDPAAAALQQYALLESGLQQKSNKKKPPQRKKRNARGFNAISTRETHVPFSEHLLRFALRVTRKPSRYLAEKIPQLKEDILRSNLSITPESIIAIGIFSTMLSFPFVLLGVYIIYTAGHGLFAPLLLITLLAPLLVSLNLPKISASSRNSALENELPYVVGYITVLAGGGISPFTAMKRIANADSIFPAASKEARRILLDIEVFGLDPISAFEKASKNTPNRKFADFLGGYVSVLKVGGDVQSYLQSQLKDVFSYRELKTKSSTETIGTLAETYIIATVVMGVSFYIIFLIQNLLVTGSQAVNSVLIELFALVFVPMISATFIFVIDSAQIKEPFTYYKPYYVFLGCIPLGVLFYFLPIGLPQYLQLGVSLAIISTPASVINSIYTRKKRSVEAKLANFLRDIAEVRKTGLAPEKTIEQLADRNYSGLTRHVKRISSQLAWGFSIRTVLETFSARVRSWVARAMAFLLLEVVDVGGGSSEMFITLAEFTEKNSLLDRERRSQVRPYVIVPYIGAVLVVVTTALMVYLLSGPGLSVGATNGAQSFMASPSVVSEATGILLVSSILQAWIMGIVAGKMGELTVSDGFKHATLLVVISVVAVYVAKMIVKF